MQGKDKIINTVSLILSAVFSPLLVPTYAFLLTMWLSIMAFTPERARLIAAIVVFLITTALPMAVIIFLMRIGKVSDSAINNRTERTIPFLCTIVCYFAAALYLHAIHAPHWLCGFYNGAAIIGIISLIINRWWKISAHAASMGGLCGALYFMAVCHLGIVNLVPWLIGAIIISGAVASARVYLGRHTLGQVLAGSSLGALVVTALMII